MKELFEALLAALRRGETAALCTILGASGSAPRGAGAKMAVFADGSTIGTVGGGAVELRTTAMAKEAIASGRSLMHGFSLAKNQIEDLGMICGGNVTIYIQILSASEPEVIPFLEDVCALLSGTKIPGCSTSCAAVRSQRWIFIQRRGGCNGWHWTTRHSPSC